MADTQTNRENRKETAQALDRTDRPRRGMQRWEPFGGLSFGSPFDFMDRMTEEMDRTFDRMLRNFGFTPRSRGGFPGLGRQGVFAPRIEAFQKGDRFIVRADLPGLKKEDVQVDLTEDALTIHGERKEEHEEQREGYFHNEREYGEFYRSVPLPEGVISESAQASFKNGVLEISMQAAPSEANRGRRLEIKEGPEGEQKK